MTLTKKNKIIPKEVQREMQKHEELFYGRKEEFLRIENQIIETCLKSRVQYIPPAVNESREEMKNRQNYLSSCCGCPPEVIHEVEKHATIFICRREDFLRNEYQIIETCLKSGVQYIPPTVNEKKADMKNRRNFLSRCCVCPPEVICEVEKYVTIFISRRDDFLHNECQIIETCLKSGVQYIPPAIGEKWIKKQQIGEVTSQVAVDVHLRSSMKLKSMPQSSSVEGKIFCAMSIR